ncbi:MAG: allophanate hydrolase subunit 1, partial [Acidimicrobiales bacterium]
MRVLPAGPRAVMVELDDQGQVLALHAEIERRRESGWPGSLTDVVPGARTILLDGLDDPARVVADVSGWAPLPPP